MSRSGRTRVGLVGVVAALALGALLAAYPVTTSQGVNYAVSTRRIPLYLKTFEFIDRSVQYAQTATAITAGATSDEARVLAVFEWTRQNIRSVPDGFPVIDDHIANIMTRGYGAADQQADVFAALTTYAGVPAFWDTLRPTAHGSGLILAFAKVDGQWRVFDVAASVAYRTSGGSLATLEDLRQHPEWVPPSIAGTFIEAVPYPDFLLRVGMPPIPRPLRAELQMPLPRVWHEMKAAVGLEQSHESER